jgi:5'-deoxynucleotidase YfbR-like HD superfamily hydrolase
MLSGRRLDLLDPSPLDIEIEDIAHGLARVARWNGQTSGDYTFSVAEHSLLVEEIAGDIDGSLSRFGLPPAIPDATTKLIKRADKAAAYFEATGLAGFSLDEARRFFGAPKGLSPKLVTWLTQLSPLPAAEGQARFLKRYHELAR